MLFSGRRVLNKKSLEHLASGLCLRINNVFFICRLDANISKNLLIFYSFLSLKSLAIHICARIEELSHESLVYNMSENLIFAELN